jgi:hypothetical protein
MFLVDLGRPNVGAALEGAIRFCLPGKQSARRAAPTFRHLRGQKASFQI